MASDAAAGEAALACLDAVLAKRPHADGHKLSEATRELSAFRNHLTAGADRRRLGHVNAVISLVLAVHFPLGAIQWDELEKARAWLADAVHEMGPG